MDRMDPALKRSFFPVQMNLLEHFQHRAVDERNTILFRQLIMSAVDIERVKILIVQYFLTFPVVFLTTFYYFFYIQVFFSAGHLFKHPFQRMRSEKSLVLTHENV